MKHQQITVDFANMVFTACSYLALAGAVWIFLRLVQACFWLPRHLKKQNDVQRMLQDKVESYEKYILECEEKEKAMLAEQEMQGENVVPRDPAQAEKWKERRECLEMLKRELNKVRDDGDVYDWNHLLDEDDETKDEGANVTEIQDNKNSTNEYDNNVETRSITGEKEKEKIESECKKDK